jgi:CRISPR-associated protein Cmr2
MSSGTIYTAITFAPVQGFIEKSRKLRDLYGSSYLLSFLAKVICLAAENENCTVISPASPNIIQGLPNVIVIQGDLPKATVEKYFEDTWACIVDTCEEWIQQNVEPAAWNYCWKRSWDAWGKYTWELFWATYSAPDGHHGGEAVQAVRQVLNEEKRARNWTGINWSGESSTLSGTDSVAHPEMELAFGSNYSKDRYDSVLATFYNQLRLKLGEQFAQAVGLRISDVQAIEYGNVFVDEREELSIPDLVKRLITHQSMVQLLKDKLPEALRPLLATEQAQQQLQFILQDLEDLIEADLSPHTFKDLNRLPKPGIPVYWTGWFMGDGDAAGKYLKNCSKAKDITDFSQKMRDWGKTFKENQHQYLKPKGRVIYAGGDDFLGVLYDTEQKLPERCCINWLVDFKPKLWDGINGPLPITPSVGFVWVSPQVPQRDLLQHCRDAEKAAKAAGRDRVALWIVFANGNTLKWNCPWQFLPLLNDYRDRTKKAQSWTHFFNDVAVLESRHAFTSDNTDVAKSLFRLYFNPTEDWKDSHQQIFYQLFDDTAKSLDFDRPEWWNRYSGADPFEGDIDGATLIATGLLGDRNHYTDDQTPNGCLKPKKVHEAINNWVINLGKVGFHLCQ